MTAGQAARRLVGRRAVITGASRGIGLGIAHRFAAEGADVALVARTVERHATLPGSLAESQRRLSGFGVRVATIAADLTAESDRARIVPEAEAALGGPVDILVNNAAAAIYQPLATYPLKRRRLTFEVNVQAPLDLAQAVLPGMLERGEGWIVNISSATARHVNSRGEGHGTDMAVYGASKAALNRITNALGNELWGSGVRVNSVEPRKGVLTEGAEALVGSDFPEGYFEPVEAMAEAALALATCGPESTGGVHVSLDLLDELGLTPLSLDGTPLAEDALRG